MSASSSAPAAGSSSSNTTTHPPLTAAEPPYPPKTAPLGVVPTVPLDVPIAASLAALFLLAAAIHMALFRRNRSRGHKFVFSLLFFVFCMARVVALVLRAVWAVFPKNVRLAIASQILTAAGVVILMVCHFLFAQRVVRGLHPPFGWGRRVTGVFRGLCASAVGVLVMVVVVTVHGFFVAEGDPARVVDRRVQLFCVTYLAGYAVLPAVVVLVAAAVPKRRGVDKFGEGGGFGTKIAVLVLTSSLLAAGAIFRAVVAYYTRPIAHPAWFHGKPCYYVFNFGVEAVVVFIYALMRFDKLFHVRNGSCAPGDYSSQPGLEGEKATLQGVDLERGGTPQSDDESELERALNRIWRPVKARLSRYNEGVHADLRSSSESSLGLGGNKDLNWIAVAMAELYGDDEDVKRYRRSHGGLLACVKLEGISDFGDDASIEAMFSGVSGSSSSGKSGC